MTLPIIPGPFSFLGEAGQAAGAIGQALTERDRYKQQIAAQNAEFLAKLVGLGVVQPEALAGADTQKIFAQAGIPSLNPSQIEVPAATQKGRRYGKELAAIPEGTPQSQLSVGLPTGADASVDAAKGAEAETSIKALAQIVSPEQLRVFKGILNPEAAALVDKLAGEKATTELEQQAPERQAAAAHNEIWQSVRRRLPKDKVFDKVADFAAVGGLSYLNAELEANARLSEGSRALNTEKIRLITATTSQATQEYNRARAQWEAGLKDAIDKGMGFDQSELSPQEYTKKKNALVKDYVARFPEPGFDDFLNEHLSASGLKPEDFQEAFRSLAHIPGAKAPQGGADPYEQVKQAARSGQVTAADVDGASSLTPQQKAEVKALIPKKKSP